MLMIITISLYEINISGAVLIQKSEETLKSLGYKSSELNNDVWINLDFNTVLDPYYKYI